MDKNNIVCTTRSSRHHVMFFSLHRHKCKLPAKTTVHESYVIDILTVEDMENTPLGSPDLVLYI